MQKPVIQEERESKNFSTLLRKNIQLVRTVYFFYFAAFGIIVTYLNIYYYDSCLSGVQIGILSSVVSLVSIVAAPMWGIWSDKLGFVKPLMMISCTGIILAVIGISLANVFLWLILFTVMFSFFDSSILPIMDSNTLRLLGENKTGYGRVRVWGSLGYISAAWGIGFILHQFGSQLLFPFFVLMIIVVIFVVNWLPGKKVIIQPALYQNILELILKKKWLVFSASLLTMGLGSVAVNGFLGIYIKELGGNEGLVGTAAALATITELPILFFGSKILKRFSPWSLLVLAFSANSIRLLLYGVMPAAWWVIPISLLHSMTFGLFWIACVAYVDEMGLDAIKSSAQGLLYSVLNISRLIGALASGFLFDQFGGGRLFIIAALFSLLSIILIWLNKPEKKYRR